MRKLAHMTKAATAVASDPRPRIPEWSVMDKMRKAREHAGVERETMADALGVSVRSIVRYENNGPVPKTAVLLYSIKTAVPAEWIDPIRCTPRDLNPEPTVSGEGALAQVISIGEARSIRVRIATDGEAA